MQLSDLSAAGGLAVIGTGKLGASLVDGWLAAGWPPDQLWLTARHPARLAPYAERGVQVGSDNRAAVENAAYVILGLHRQQIPPVLEALRPALTPGHRVVSVAAMLSLEDLAGMLSGTGAIGLRAMPGTTARLRQSMTCLAGPVKPEVRAPISALFEALGKTMWVEDNLMDAATILCSSAVAFAMRFVRAASQAGTEMGFEPEEAQQILAQTTLGAASLLWHTDNHPEDEVDRVTTPAGVTITGLNQMEHDGFSSAIIRGMMSAYGKMKPKA